jgi:hypothetical protein
MKKRITRAALAAVTLTGLLGATPAAADSGPATAPRPAAAQPAPGAPTPVRAGADLARISAADGYLYAYDLPNFGGAWCRWDRNDNWWGDDCGNFNDRATSLWNNGFPGYYSEVALKRDVEFGIHAREKFCIEAGNYYADLSLGYEKFLDGVHADNAISAHFWFTDDADYIHDPHYAC